MSDVISINGISKSYGKNLVVENLNVNIPKGRIIGLLGENGVGKTTLLKIIAGILHPDKGYIKYHEKGISQKLKSYVSYLVEPKYFYSWMKIKDVICYYKDHFDNFNENLALSYCEKFDLKLNDKIKLLSKGNQEKVSLLISLSIRAKVYLLDEPAGGFDLKFKKEVIKIILESINDDKTIIISTHLLKDFGTILDEIMILKKKSLICISCDEIREIHKKSVEEYYLDVIENG